MEKQFIINPFVGVGIIVFNSKRDFVRKQLGEYSEFRKSKFSKNTTDNFGTFHVFYSQKNTVDAVEFFPGSNVIYKGHKMFDLDREALISLYNDDKMVQEEDSINFISYGVEVVIEEERITSIFVHKAGY